MCRVIERSPNRSFCFALIALGIAVGCGIPAVFGQAGTSVSGSKSGKSAKSGTAATNAETAGNAASQPQSPAPIGGKPQNPAPSAPAPTPNPVPANVPNAISKAALSQIPVTGGDYLPCRFTVAELQNLHDPQNVLTLSGADAETLKQTVIMQTMTASGSLPPGLGDQIIRGVAAAEFTGLTPSQALGKTIDLINQAKLDYKAPPTSPQLSAAVKGFVQQLDAIQNPDQSTVTQVLTNGLHGFGERDKSAVEPLAGKLLEMDNPTKDDIKKATDQFLADTSASKADVNSVVNSARGAISRLERPPDVGCAMSILSYDETSKAYGRIIAQNYIAVQVVVRNLNKTEEFALHDVEYAVNTDASGNPGRFFSGRDKVVVRALSTAQQSFDLRNIFVQSAEGAGSLFSSIAPIVGGRMVDASGVFNGAFLPSLEKAWKDQSKDQLNLLNDTGFSSMANSQTVVPKGSTVMLVTFVPSKQFTMGWWTQPCANNIYLGTKNPHGAIYPRRTVSLSPDGDDQEVARALQACATQISAPNSGGGFLRRKPVPPSFLHLPVSAEDAIVAVEPPVVANGRTTTKLTLAAPVDSSFYSDVARVRGVFDGAKFDNTFDVTIVDETHVNIEGTLPKNYLAGSGNLVFFGDDIFRESKPQPYSSWSGQSLQLFANLSLVVVAGTHNLDQKDLELSITQLKCPADGSGNFAFPSPVPPNITCTMTGKNLDKSGKLIARNSQDATDPATVTGVVSVSGDSTTATVVFPGETLRCLAQPSYALYAISGNGAEQPTSQMLHFVPAPYARSVTPQDIKFTSTLKSQDVKAEGCGLASVTGLQMQSMPGNQIENAPLAAGSTATDGSVSFTIDSSKLTKFGASEPKIKLSLITKSGNSPVGIDPVLSLDGLPAPAPPVAAPAPQPVPAPQPTPAPSPAPVPPPQPKQPASQGRGAAATKSPTAQQGKTSGTKAAATPKK